jgi:sorting and assembly machinery component 37
VASHVLLFVTPPFPDRLLTDLITGYYPTLTAHAHRVYEHSLPKSLPPSAVEATSLGHVLHSLLPNLRSTSSDAEKLSSKKEREPEDVRFDKMRWGFFALVVGTVVVFLKLGGLGLRVKFQSINELDNKEEEEEEWAEEAEEEAEEMEQED